ncbi:hypothetical protein BTUL_0290g00070 [Botrytis tulipae]|uniref:Uncharacterized protein n=1 Tax=Botrytis tulipae TaxID=87230 RepID=A0A4Z1E994_9HELO|nr:hypothetical protein BTUL_0290g00070 [Botrytis tulipae]
MNLFPSLQEATKLSQYDMALPRLQFLIEDYHPWMQGTYSFDVLGFLSEANKDTSSIESSRSVESRLSHLDFYFHKPREPSMLDEESLLFSMSEETFNPLILPQRRFFRTPAPWRRLMSVTALKLLL